MDRRGCVRIGQEFGVEVPFYRYTAQWQPEPMTPPPLFYSEDGPGWNDVEDVISWARVRAPVVYVRVGEGASEHFNAGERDGRAADQRWPRVPRRRAANRDPDYGGVVFVTEESPFFRELDEFNAWWFDEDEFVLERGAFSDVDAAIAWGRERATVVLVARAGGSPSVPVYDVSAVGEQDFAVSPPARVRPRRSASELRWEYRLQRAAHSLTSAVLSQRLQDALADDPAVVFASCSVSQRPPRHWGVPGPFFDHSDKRRAEYRAVIARPPSSDAWVNIAIGVAAPTHRQAHTVAVQALHRALSAAGEQATAWEADKRLVRVA